MAQVGILGYWISHSVAGLLSDPRFERTCNCFGDRSSAALLENDSAALIQALGRVLGKTVAPDK
jgi:hypothetical protein